ncbi:FixH family protein [Microbacteriaceae bacterium 4G12]
MKKLLIAIVVLVFALAGCGSQAKKKSDEAPKEVKVEVKTNPKTIKANESVEIQAIVTQDGKNVDDADDVKFEIWKDGDQKKEMFEAKHKGNGVYAIEKTFPVDGVYQITAHTNARDMHVMPTVKVTVGNGQAAHDSHAGDEHHSDVMMHFTADNLKANVATPVKAHVMQKNEPVTGAEVQFEIWKDGSDKHEYVPAKEGKNGEYTATPTFKEAGSYTMKLHVKKGELHAHTEQKVEVK